MPGTVLGAKGVSVNKTGKHSRLGELIHSGCETHTHNSIITFLWMVLSFIISVFKREKKVLIS